MEDGVEQAAARGVALIEARLQPVAQRHQFIDPGDDAALLFSRHRQGVHYPKQRTNFREAGQNFVRDHESLSFISSIAGPRKSCP